MCVCQERAFFFVVFGVYLFSLVVVAYYAYKMAPMHVEQDDEAAGATEIVDDLSDAEDEDDDDGPGACLFACPLASTCFRLHLPLRL
jgi:hypothetical protein